MRNVHSLETEQKRTKMFHFPVVVWTSEKCQVLAIRNSGFVGRKQSRLTQIFTHIKITVSVA